MVIDLEVVPWVAHMSIIRKEYSWPLNNTGVRGFDYIFHVVKNPHITLQLTLCTHSSAPVDSANHRSRGTVVFIRKHSCVSGPVPFKPMLFKGQLYFMLEVNKITIIWHLVSCHEFMNIMNSFLRLWSLQDVLTKLIPSNLKNLRPLPWTWSVGLLCWHDAVTSLPHICPTTLKTLIWIVTCTQMSPLYPILRSWVSFDEDAQYLKLCSHLLLLTQTGRIEYHHCPHWAEWGAPAQVRSCWSLPCAHPRLWTMTLIPFAVPSSPLSPLFMAELMPLEFEAWSLNTSQGG